MNVICDHPEHSNYHSILFYIMALVQLTLSLAFLIAEVVTTKLPPNAHFILLSTQRFYYNVIHYLLQANS